MRLVRNAGRALHLRLAAGGGASPAPGLPSRRCGCSRGLPAPRPPTPTRLCKGLLYLETFTEPFWIVLALIGF